MIKPLRIQNHLHAYVQRTLGVLAGSGISGELLFSTEWWWWPSAGGLREWFGPGCSPSPSLLCAEKSLSCFSCVLSCASLSSCQKYRPAPYVLLADLWRKFCSPALPLWSMPRACAVSVPGALLPWMGVAFLQVLHFRLKSSRATILPHTYTHVCTCTHAHTHIHIHINTCKSTFTYRHMCTNSQTQRNTNLHHSPPLPSHSKSSIV